MEVLPLFNQDGSRKLQLASSFLRLLSSLIIMHLFNYALLSTVPAGQS